MEQYAVEFWGGHNNGAVRYYKQLSSAKASAKKYVKNAITNTDYLVATAMQKYTTYKENRHSNTN